MLTRDVANKKPPAPTKKKSSLPGTTPAVVKSARNDENDLSSANTTSATEMEDSQVALRPKSNQTGGERKKQCKVLFSYSPGHEDELELKTDDIIDLLGKWLSF